MRARVLGPVAVVADGVEVSLPAGKPRALLAMLALSGGQPVSVDRLVAGLWGDDAPANAGKTLQVHVSTLRSRLRAAGVGIDLTAAGYRLDLCSDEIDVWCFERLAEEGMAALADRPEIASRTLQRALGLWLGEPLSNVQDAPFAAHVADALMLRRLNVAQARIEADLALGLGTTLVDELRQLVEANPYNERACGQLMVALYRAGQPVAALEAYRALQRRLGEELGVVAGPDLVDLERQILVHDDKLLVRPLGRAASRHNLPRHLSNFIGREREFDDVRAVMHISRLATVTGAGGAGKTRLALAVATSLADEITDGAWLVELATLTAPELVVSTTARTLGLRHEEGLEAITEGIGDRALLIVLDNCEHLIDAAAKLVDGLLRLCPNVRILATSREPLAIGGEHVYRIPPLGLPPSDVTSAAEALCCDAVRLFVDRAELHRADFALDDVNAEAVARLCAWLDGMPLAIELAAARLRMFPVAELARRVVQRLALLTGSDRMAPARQQTMHRVIDWSYELLSGEEALMLERLSVFAGGFTVADVEAIFVEVAPQVTELLSALVDKSLIEVDFQEAGRLRLLEAIREYARQRFSCRSPEIMHSALLAHARHYLAIAQQAAPALDLGPGQREWLQRLTVEFENLRAAADTFLHMPGGAEDGLRLANNLVVFWVYRGLFDEGATTTASLLELPDVDHTTETYVQGLCTAIEMFENLGDLRRAEQLIDTATPLASQTGKRDLEMKVALRRSVLVARHGEYERALEIVAPYLVARLNQSELARLHTMRAYYLWHLNDPVGARASLATAEGAARSAGNERRLALVLTNLSSLDLAERDLQGAKYHLEEAHAVAARLADYPTLTSVAANLGLVAILQRNYDEAWTRYREALNLAWPGGSLDIIHAIILGLALCCGTTGNDHVAATLHGVIETSADNPDNIFDPNESELRHSDRERLRKKLGQIEFESAVQRGHTMTLVEAVTMAKEAATWHRIQLQASNER